MQQDINIAIDGWSACGKGTLASGLASYLGYLCIDSGAMYRAFTLQAIRHGIEPEHIEGLETLISQTKIEFERNGKGTFDILLNGKNVESEIRTKEVSSKVSQYSAISAVRRFLVFQQQEIAKNKGVVMDGRDIGSVVIPDAELKIFMTARPEVRAQRRYKQQKNVSGAMSLEEVASNLMQRDVMDSQRADSPLVQLPDARVLDNSDLSMEQQLNIVIGWVEEIKTSRGVGDPL
jgi:cytidylate kinase